MLYNQKHFNRFSIVAVPTMGGNIWGLNEKMIRNSKAKDKWITQYILKTIGQFKTVRGVPAEIDDYESYVHAVIQITVAGREGRFVHPLTGQIMSPTEFSNTFSRYYFETSLGDSEESFKRIKKSFYNIFFEKAQSFRLFKESWWRTNSAYELQDTYLMIPSSLSDIVSLKIAALPLASTQYLTPEGWFKNIEHTDKFDNAIPLHVDQRTDQAFVYQKSNPNIFWINLWADFNWSSVIFLVFLASLFVFFISGEFMKFDMAQYFILGHALFFTILPGVFSQGQSRYSLYSTAAMLIFSVSVWYRDGFKKISS
jgi:hypothetical protein